MQPAKINYKIYQGATFQETFRWESETKVYVPISGIAKSAPCVITTTTPHDLPVGWRFRVVGAGGMKEINSVGDDAYYLSTATPTTTTIEINQTNSLGYTAYTSGGVVEYNQPVPLTGLQARMQIRETVDSTTVIHEATTQNSQIVLDQTGKTIQITLLANVTQTFNFPTAVYSLELYNGNNVIPFISGNLTLVQEVTR
jgi:hypothetical protein